MKFDKIENLAWVLPRPRKVKYKGGFPLHAEIKILREIGCDPKKNPSIKILHPFGGKAEYGIRVDINPEVNPDYIGDAHNLTMFEDEIFDVVFLDPPYTDEYSESLYNTGKLNFSKYTKEAVRILKEGGYLIMYHYLATPQIPNTILVKRIFIETRPWHRIRVVHIHYKSKKLWELKKNEINKIKIKRQRTEYNNKTLALLFQE